ncbi:MAG: hypothetical protein KAX38_06910, partial [Candidatus Krumholzibacteria bacterium]|nr:hypothetical protein [Candidatus Krumholzibacteria bacterium]
MSEVATSSGDTSRPSGEAARAFEQPKGPVETFGVNCPTCGGSLCVHEGERSIRCEYCGSALYVTRPQGVRSFMMQPRITAGKARFSALRYLAEQTGGRVKARHASIIDLRLIQAPFWRMRGKLMGWVCGDKIKLVEVEMASPNPQSQTVHKTTREERIPYSKLVFKRVDWSTPACVLRHLGLQGISLRTGFLEWDIFDHELTGKH